MKDYDKRLTNNPQQEKIFSLNSVTDKPQINDGGLPIKSDTDELTTWSPEYPKREQPSRYGDLQECHAFLGSRGMITNQSDVVKERSKNRNSILNNIPH